MTVKTTHRNNSKEIGDINRLARYFTASPLARRTHTIWCVGRLVDWKYSLLENKRAYTGLCNDNTNLWFDDFGELAGFAISEGIDAGFQILPLPGYRFLFEEMLQWVLDAWQERPAKFGSGLSTEIAECQALEAKVVERYRTVLYAQRISPARFRSRRNSGILVQAKRPRACKRLHHRL